VVPLVRIMIDECVLGLGGQAICSDCRANPVVLNNKNPRRPDGCQIGVDLPSQRGPASLCLSRGTMASRRGPTVA